MVWEVECTDEFGVWWMGLDDYASKRVAAAVNLLATPVRPCNFLIHLALTDRAMPTCGNCGCEAKAIRCESSTRSILAERRFCCSAATRMDLTQLRTAHQLSQAALGEILHVEQPAIAKLEKRTDMYVSTLRRFIEAMGGELEITARFPDHSIRIKNFGDLAERDPA